MFKSRMLPLPKATLKANNNKSPLGDYDNIFTIGDNPKNDWDPSIYMQGTSELRIRASLPA